MSEWRDPPGRKPLVLRGARQVGKTYLVEHWGAGHFDSVMTVDLERERDLHSLFSRSDPKRVLDELGVLRGRDRGRGAGGLPQNVEPRATAL